MRALLLVLLVCLGCQSTTEPKELGNLGPMSGVYHVGDFQYTNHCLEPQLKLQHQNAVTDSAKFIFKMADSVSGIIELNGLYEIADSLAGTFLILHGFDVGFYVVIEDVLVTTLSFKPNTWVGVLLWSEWQNGILKGRATSQCVDFDVLLVRDLM